MYTSQSFYVIVPIFRDCLYLLIFIRVHNSNTHLEIIYYTMNSLIALKLVLLMIAYFTDANVGVKTLLRLSGGSGPHEGNVELFYKGQWKYICDDHWDIRDAKVVCRQLNFTKAIKATAK